MTAAPIHRTRSLGLLLVATMAGMSPWFLSAAILPDMAREAGRRGGELALLSSVVPAGFSAGAMVFALSGLTDRGDPRKLFAGCAVGAALASLLLLVVPIGGSLAVALRFATGAFMAGVWPITMKIAVGWSLRLRGLIVATMAAGLVAGKALPYLFSWLGGADWRVAIVWAAALTAGGGVLVLFTSTGPHHARAEAFRPRAIWLIWTDRSIRAAVLAYLGHMWEFIAFWAWVGVATAASFAHHMPEADAVSLGKLTGFLCIFIAAPACVVGGLLADRYGKARVAAAFLALSGSAAVLTALTFGGPVWLTILLVMVWGAAVIPDSPQFSALVADHAPPDLVGSLLTFQASLGFLLTVFTTQGAIIVAEAWGWPALMLILALGPVFGLIALRPALRRDALRSG